MIKFFRKIRQRVLIENNISKYLIYAIGEIILVVLGILIALQIDNWNENRKESRIVHNYYDQLISDLNADIDYARDRIDKISAHRQQYFKYEKGFEQPNMQPYEIFNLMDGYSFNSLDIEYNSSTIETLINTGDIKLLDTKIRALLSMYNKQKIQTTELNRQNNNDVSDLLKEVMLRGGIMPIIQETKLKNQAYLGELVNFEDRFSDFCIALKSYFLWRDTIEINMIESLNGNKNLAEEIVQVLESKMELSNNY